uniref:Unconventional myosin heavy chain 6 n=1 Tax=Caenorhabditis tropicalis TaxID=1561998 RepID=A0A1I7TBZ6_9PELO
MVLVSKGDFIWIEPGKSEGSIPIGARVIDQDHGRLKVIDDLGNEQWLSADRRVRLMHPTSVQGVEDMCQLGDFHESAILRNLFIRYREKLIYAYTGSILIAVNPYMDIAIYTADEIRMYKRKRIGELPPHIFAIADNAYTNMRRERKNQSVIISGESGAGKTESTKLVLQFLATISGQHSWIEQQVLEANPVLEAFGNAKTIRNDNSSRFGKYIDVHFNESGSIEGAKIEQYLLEKSRIVTQSENERNYHIFYCLLAGLSKEEKFELELGTAADYYYLIQGKTLTAEGRDDAADLAEIRSAMRVLMINEQEISSIFKLLAALLHIGNIRFRQNTTDNMESVDVADPSTLVRIAKLLHLHEQNLLDAITTKSLVTREERVISRLNGQQAIDARDALAKAIYGKLFIHIVRRVNDAIYKPSQSKRTSIGILDIFGFENFESNSFEQLCINFANETLQQFFVQHVFKMEQKEYDEENINWRHIKFVDNQATVDLIAQRPLNILSLIDEESIFPKGTDKTMLLKLHSTHGRNELYLQPKSELQRAFGVTHFAGNVFYNTRGFLEKNRDSFSADLSALISSSKMPFLARLFDDIDYDTSSRKKVTVGNQFRRSLEQLMTQLTQTHPFFIRCIKPNELKRALVMDRDLVLRQLRYSGMMETIKIRRSGYPIRHDYYPFVFRYRVLVPSIRGPVKKIDVNDAAKKICHKVLGTNADYQLGKTKVFLKDKHDLVLEQEYYRVLKEKAIIIQKNVRRWFVRKDFEKQRQAAVTIQTAWRGYDQRKRYRQIISGFSRLQAVLRSRQLVSHYQSLRKTIIQFQAVCRGTLLRRQVGEMRKRGEKAPLTEISSTASIISDSHEGELVSVLFDFLPSDGKDSGNENDSADSSRRGSYSRLHPSPVMPPANIPRVDSFIDEDLSKFQFGKYAATFFQAQATATHIKKPLKTALLTHTEPSAQLGALAAWTTILRFMGDLPDTKPGSTNGSEIYDKTPVMSRLYATLGKKFSSRDVEEALIGTARGWILLSLCVGCFAPSERFIKYLFCFIRERGPAGTGYSTYIEDRLRRTQVNGTRHQPPSYVELQANKSQKPVVLAVTFMDGSVKTLCADSATTASELCKQLAEKVGLTNSFGFSLYIALFDKVSSLGSGTDHVMDAISQCEQYAKEQGRQERNAPWRLFFRKEIFSPWHDPKDDPVSTNLIYQQVIRGIKYGEYRCDKDEELAAICAQQYYIDEGTMDVNKLENNLTSYLPDFEMAGKDMALEKWTQTIMHQYRKKFTGRLPSQIEVKEDVVSIAKTKWPLLFSRFYEALKFAGPPLPKNEVIIAVNWTGVYVVDDREHVMLEFSFPEVSTAYYSKGKRSTTDTCTIRTVVGDEYTFQSPNADDITNLIVLFLEGLKKRSRYLVAVKSQKGDEKNNFLEFEKGDLLILVNEFTGNTLLTESVVKGENSRTCLFGLIRAENVYVLPTLVKPSKNTLQIFPKDMDLSLDLFNNNKQVTVIDYNAEPYTLEKFAEDNFNSQVKRVGSQISLMTLRKRESQIESWRFSRDHIEAPLLKKLNGRDDACRGAVEIFAAIMKYMGDEPSKRSRLGTHLTDHIFKLPISMEALRDELYCQLAKQLTLNPSIMSEERGWELLWMATGLFAPSAALAKEISHFLKSRPHPIALDCQNRMQKLAKGGSRKYPPHLVEVEAIQHKTTQIFHKVFFPDNTDEAIEVDSATRARDFCHKIGYRLGLKSSDGFSLFVKIKDKVLAVPETEFFFDYVRSLSDWVHTNHAMQKDSTMIPINYQVYFMRKLWYNFVPGADPQADIIFHYHQESQKYLLGYHKTTKNDVIELAALNLRAMTKDGKNAPLAQIPQLLEEIVSKDSLKMYSASEWRKTIGNAYARVEHLKSDQAKIEFLNYICRWPTFGSAFFPVSQYSDLSLPDRLLLAINQTGVNIYNLETKNLLVQYPFNVICNWTSGNTYFNMTVGNMLKGNEGKKLLLDTTVGYKMDDLLTSYISLLISNQNNHPSKNREVAL